MAALCVMQPCAALAAAAPVAHPAPLPLFCATRLACGASLPGRTVRHQSPAVGKIKSYRTGFREQQRAEEEARRELSMLSMSSSGSGQGSPLTVRSVAASVAARSDAAAPNVLLISLFPRLPTHCRWPGKTRQGAPCPASTPPDRDWTPPRDRTRPAPPAPRPARFPCGRVGGP